MDGESKGTKETRPRLKLVGGHQAEYGRRVALSRKASQEVRDAGTIGLAPTRKYHVVFQMAEHPGGPWKDCGAWGDSFRGVYNLDAIVEILRAFDANGVRLTCVFLEDELGEDIGEIDAVLGTQGKLAKGGPRRWRVIYSVCPMMFAAAKGLDRTVGAALNAQRFTPQPDLLLNGTPALGMALRAGWRSDIAMLLLMSGPRRETVQAALEMLRERREDEPDDDNLYQGLRADAVEAMLEAELLQGKEFWEGFSGDDSHERD